MKPYWRSFMSLSLASVLVACSLGVPAPVSKPESPSLRGLIQPVSLEREAPVQQARAHTPKTVTFPDMVKKTPVQDAEPSEAPELDEALAALEQDEADFSIASHRHPRFFAASFKTNTHPRSQYQVKIPESGNFKLVLEEADRFKIVDKDATDGEAKIQMPASTLKTFLYLKGKRRNRATLEIEDPLYHVKDTISTARRWGKWLRLGLRPLPVPTDWRSDFGNQMVFKMTTQDVKHFAMVWLLSSKTAAFPPGIAEIDPTTGGALQLPGVATVVIPKGAIQEKTVFVLKQELEAPDLSEFTTGLRENHEYAGPVVSIFPKVILGGQYTSGINIAVDKEKYKGVSAFSIEYFITSYDNKTEPEDSLGIISGSTIDSFTHDSFRILKETGRVFPAVSTYYKQSNSGGFSTQQTTEEQNRLYENEDNYFVDPSMVNRQDIDRVLERSWTYYADSQTGRLPEKLEFETYTNDCIPNIQNLFQCDVDKVYYFVPVFPGPPLVTTKNNQNFRMSAPDSALTPQTVTSLYHESFHIFQFANISIDNFREAFQSGSEVEFGERTWLYESSARFMGAKLYFEHYQDYYAPERRPNFPDDFYDKVQIREVLGTNAGESIHNMSCDFFSHTCGGLEPSSLYFAPKGLDEPDTDDAIKYGRTGLFALISQLEKNLGQNNQNVAHLISEICKTYSQIGNFSSTGALFAINNELNKNGERVYSNQSESKNLEYKYPEYVTAYILKDLGLGLSVDLENDIALENAVVQTHEATYLRPNVNTPLVDLRFGTKNPEAYLENTNDVNHPLSTALNTGLGNAAPQIIPNLGTDVYQARILLNDSLTSELQERNLLARVENVEVIAENGNRRPLTPEEAQIFRHGLRVLPVNFKEDSKALTHSISDFQIKATKNDKKWFFQTANIPYSRMSDLVAEPEASSEQWHKFYIQVTNPFMKRNNISQIAYTLKFFASPYAQKAEIIEQKKDNKEARSFYLYAKYFNPDNAQVFVSNINYVSGIPHRQLKIVEHSIVSGSDSEFPTYKVLVEGPSFVVESLEQEGQSVIWFVSDGVRSNLVPRVEVCNQSKLPADGDWGPKSINDSAGCKSFS